MTPEMKALQTLVSMRRRAGERLSVALAQARSQAAACQDDVQVALDDHARSVGEEETARSELDDLMHRAFTPDAMRALGFRIDDMKAAATRAQRQVVDCRQALERQAQLVAAAQQEIRVNTERLSGFQEQFDRLLRERNSAVEEREEEETNETATTRFLARRRETREGADG